MEELSSRSHEIWLQLLRLCHLWQIMPSIWASLVLYVQRLDEMVTFPKAPRSSQGQSRMCLDVVVL